MHILDYYARPLACLVVIVMILYVPDLSECRIGAAVCAGLLMGGNMVAAMLSSTVRGFRMQRMRHTDDFQRLQAVDILVGVCEVDKAAAAKAVAGLGKLKTLKSNPSQIAMMASERFKSRV